MDSLPHGAEKGRAGQEGVGTGSAQAKDGTGCRGGTSGPQSPESSILPTGGGERGEACKHAHWRHWQSQDLKGVPSLWKQMCETEAKH